MARTLAKSSYIEWLPGSVPASAIDGLPDAVSSGIMPVATRTELAAVDPNETPVCYLQEAGREGVFAFKSGNFAARITAQNGTDGIYVEHDTIADTTGAWERVDHKYGWRTDWFGWTQDGGGGGGVNTDGPAKGLFDLGNIVKPQLIEISEGIYSFDTALPDISWQVEIGGARGQQSTILNKRYNTGSASRGLLAFNNFGFHLHDLTIRATAGSNGRGISATLTVASPASGRSFMERLNVSGGPYWNGSLAIDGSANTSAGGPSYRGLWISDCEFFGGAVDAVNLRSVHHLFMTGVFIATTGGSSATALIINGDATAYNDDVHIHGIISGNTSMTRLARSTFHSPRIGDITNDSTCSGITWTGANISGTHQTNWTGSAYVG